MRGSPSPGRRFKTEGAWDDISRVAISNPPDFWTGWTPRWVSFYKSRWRSETLGVFTPAVGAEAARNQWRANEMHIYFSIGMVVSVFPTVALALTGFSLLAWIWFIPTFLLTNCFLLLRFVFRHRFFAAASTTLGCRLDLLHLPDRERLDGPT